MNKVFNFKRFTNYLAYDLKNALNNYGASLLVVGLLPIITFTLMQVMIWVFSPDYAGQEVGVSVRVMTILVGIIVVELTAPARLYGRITDRRYGSDWFLLPASLLEKFLSMLILMVIVLPLVMGLALLFSDTLVALLFPARYGENLFTLLHGINLFNLAVVDEPDLSINMNLGSYMLIQWAVNILIFTLGALCFKKAKAAKTILVVLGVSIVLSNIVGVLLIDAFPSATDFILCDPSRAVRLINAYVNVTCFGLVLLVGGGIYYRIRTMQH